MPTLRNDFEKKVAGQLGPEFRYEVKRLTYTLAEDRRKHLVIRDQYSDWNVTFVFQKPDKKLSKMSKTSYSDWCTNTGML